LAAARELFAKRGFARVSMDEIAAKAGLTKPTLYAAFEDKADVFYRALSIEVADWSRQLLAAADPGLPAPELLAAHALNGMAQLKDRPLVLALLSGECESLGWASKGFAELRAKLNESTVRILEIGVSQGAFRDDLDLVTTADLLLDLQVSAALFHGLNSPAKADVLAARFVVGFELVLRGLTRRASAG